MRVTRDNRALTFTDLPPEYGVERLTVSLMYMEETGVKNAIVLDKVIIPALIAGMGVAEVVSLVVQDCLGHPWVDDELKAHLAKSFCSLFPNQVEAINSNEDEVETQRRDEKRGLYGGLVDDSN